MWGVEDMSQRALMKTCSHFYCWNLTWLMAWHGRKVTLMFLEDHLNAEQLTLEVSSMK